MHQLKSPTDCSIRSYLTQDGSERNLGSSFQDGEMQAGTGTGLGREKDCTAVLCTLPASTLLDWVINYARPSTRTRGKGAWKWKEGDAFCVLSLLAWDVSSDQVESYHIISSYCTESFNAMRRKCERTQHARQPQVPGHIRYIR